MTWLDLSRAIGVSVSTITGTKKGGRMEVDGMLAMVSWLGVPVEAFVRERDCWSTAGPFRATAEEPFAPTSTLHSPSHFNPINRSALPSSDSRLTPWAP